MSVLALSTARPVFDKRDLLGNRFARTFLGLICVAVICVGAVRQLEPQPFQGADFITAYQAALDLRQGGNPYAEVVNWTNGYRFGDPLPNYYVYSPTYALLILPLTFVPFQQAVSVWGTCIVGFLFLSVYALLRSSGSRPSAIGLLALVMAASLTTSVRSELFLGQANVFLLACVCGAIWARLASRTWLAAVLLGIAFATKPMLLPLVAFLLWKREFALVCASLLAALTLFLVPFLWLGNGALHDLTYVWHFWSTQRIGFDENLAPRGLLERLFNVNPVAAPIAVAPWLAVGLWLVSAGVVGICCLAVIKPRPLRRDPRSLLELGTILSAVLLISPLTEAPYFVFLLVPWIAAVVCLRELGWERPTVRWSVVALAGLWGLLLIPHRATLDWMPETGPASWMLTVLATAAPALFILVATFTLQLELSRLASGRRTQQEVSGLLHDSSRLALEWARDFRAWGVSSVRTLVR